MEPVVQLSEKGTKEMDEKDKKIAELEQKCAEMQKQLDAANASKDQNSDDEGDDDTQSGDNADLKSQLEEAKKKLADYEAAAKKAEADKQLSEKKAKFDKLLNEGKAVEAQREPFMAGDALKFAELSQPINLGGKGSAQDDNTSFSDGSVEEAQKEVLKLAQARLSEKKSSDIGSAIAAVLSENESLRKKYQG
jgi:hypothetical protein